MEKILFIDSWLLNCKVIEQDTVEYFNSINIKYKFFEAGNSEDGLKLVKENEPNIIFLDISSKEFDGLQLLRDIKSLDIRQPKIIAVTELGDKYYRFEALKLKVYRYIYKPYDCREIKEALSKFFNKNYYSNEINNSPDFINVEDLNTKVENIYDSGSFTDNSDDDFMDFDDNDDDFMDFDEEEDDIEHSKELMDAYNDSHKKVTAKEFLEEYTEFGVNTEELEDLEDELDRIVANILFENNLEYELPDIIYMLEKYNRFLYMFSEFEELSKVIYGLIELLNSIDFNTLSKISMVSKFIIAIIQDLVDWKEHVFVLENAVDVYYINASILNSFVQLKDIIKR